VTIRSSVAHCVALMKRRRRSLPFRQTTGVYRQTYSAVPGSGFTTPSLVDKKPVVGGSATKVGSQVTDSENHPGWRKRLTNANSLQDIGGDFFTQRQYVEGTPSLVNLRYSVQESFRNIRHSNYSGNVWSIDARTMPFPPAINSSVAQLDQLGAKAIARVNPQNSIANLSVTLGELLREGIPRARVNQWKDEMRAHKNAGNAYLGFQFGLSPLGKEIGTLAAAVTQADQLLAQYERDAGRVVRRRYEFPTERTETTTEVGSSSYPYYEPLQSDFMSNSPPFPEAGVLIRRRTTTIKRWFSGAFTYYLPTGYDSRVGMHRNALIAKEILGLDLDLEVAWNLAPWSWAIDWFSNAGDVLANVQRFAIDGSILRYGYIMEHTMVRDTFTRKHTRPFKDNSIAVDSSVSLITETKMRRRANPYGFGVSWDGLSAFQVSILAALGITRGK
jgi:hypothetical protein